MNGPYTEVPCSACHGHPCPRCVGSGIEPDPVIRTALQEAPGPRDVNPLLRNGIVIMLWWSLIIVGTLRYPQYIIGAPTSVLSRMWLLGVLSAMVPVALWLWSMDRTHRVFRGTPTVPRSIEATVIAALSTALVAWAFCVALWPLGYALILLTAGDTWVRPMKDVHSPCG